MTSWGSQILPKRPGLEMFVEAKQWYIGIWSLIIIGRSDMASSTSLLQTVLGDFVRLGSWSLIS